MRNKKRHIILKNIEIIDIAAGGKAIAKSHYPALTKGEGEGSSHFPEKSEMEGNTLEASKKTGLIVFVKRAIPGDVVDLEIYKKKKNYAEGRIIKFHKYSELRTEPFCSHFGTCGGCVWQNLNYEKQLFYKQKEVIDAFTHIARLNINTPERRENGNRENKDDILILPIIPSEKQTYYRNKLEFAFSNKRWLNNEEIKFLPFGKDLGGALGFHISGLFDKVLDIDHCYLQPGPSNEIRLEVKNFALKNGLSFFDFREQKGFMRNLIIRNSTLGELMVIIVFCPLLPSQKDGENLSLIKSPDGESIHVEQQKLLLHIAEKFPEITSLMYINNPKKNDSIYDLDVHLCKGRGFIYEELEGLKFKISPKSFFQTNSWQALELYKAVRKMAQICNTDIVYDLYTGTGTIANFVAHKAKKVIGIENIPDAIEDAKENSRINTISNTEFFAGDIKNILNDDFLEKHGKPSVIITDPPRAGMEEKVVKKILEIEAERIVYVSCNPATQARDVAILNAKYDLKKIQPIDMFPHTHHVENVAVLERRSRNPKTGLF